MARELVQPVRRCGLRYQNATYITSAEGSGGGCLPPFVVINPPVPVQRKPHRGPVVVDGKYILYRWPEDTWLVGSSARRQEKAKADQWSISTFGMTLTNRLNTGECKGIKTAEEAYATLLAKVVWSERVKLVLRSMTLNKVADLPNVAQHFADAVSSIQSFVLSEQQSHYLVDLAGACWRIATVVQPRHRNIVVDDLVRIMTLIGLKRDAAEMMARYGA